MPERIATVIPGLSLTLVDFHLCALILSQNLDVLPYVQYGSSTEEKVESRGIPRKRLVPRTKRITNNTPSFFQKIFIKNKNQ